MTDEVSTLRLGVRRATPLLAGILILTSPALAQDVRTIGVVDDVPLYSGVSSIAFDPRTDFVFVADLVQNVVFVFDSLGGLVQRIGQQGKGPGDFDSPVGSPYRRMARFGCATIHECSSFSGNASVHSKAIASARSSTDHPCLTGTHASPASWIARASAISTRTAPVRSLDTHIRSTLAKAVRPARSLCPHSRIKARARYMSGHPPMVGACSTA